MADKLAKIIRVISVPPVWAAILILSLTFYGSGIFPSTAQTLFALLFLTVIPALAYPLSAVIPALRKKGREGQRNLAFALSGVGYVGGWLYGTLARCGSTIIFLYATYLFSVIVLLIFNKLLHLRASGHACSVTGPIALIFYFLGSGWDVFCVCSFAAILWASVRSKRHTVIEFLLGSLSVFIAMGASWLIYMR